MGAAGRDFHNFNTFYRNNPDHQVVAFTATQIPDIEGRRYPPELAGAAYPDGIPIYAESALVELIQEHQIDQVIFAYSDVSHEYVMHKASLVLASGADFVMLGSQKTLLRSNKPVVSVDRYSLVPHTRLDDPQRERIPVDIQVNEKPPVYVVPVCTECYLFCLPDLHPGEVLRLPPVRLVPEETVLWIFYLRCVDTEEPHLHTSVYDRIAVHDLKKETVDLRSAVLRTRLM